MPKIPFRFVFRSLWETKKESTYIAYVLSKEMYVRARRQADDEFIQLIITTKYLWGANTETAEPLVLTQEQMFQLSGKEW